ncbi:MAG: CRTAC1 family protein [Pirellulales bacterium]
MRLVPRHPCVLLRFALAGALLVGCSRTPAPSSPPAATNHPWFDDVTRDARLDFVHDPGPSGSYFMPQSMGSGAALFDFDQDGRLDIYLVQGAGFGSKARNRLYRQEEDGSFRDVSEDSGLDVAGFGTGVAIGDVNNDGLPDVFLSEYGRIRLLVNQGGKSATADLPTARFADLSREAGLASLLWGTSASFLDFDRDGWLDLVVVNYVDYDPTRPCYGRSGERDFCSPTQFDGTLTRLYRNVTADNDSQQRGTAPPRSSGTSFGNSTAENDSQPPRFEDVTEASGLGAVQSPGLGVVCADFNHDGWDDIFVANDQQPNRLWINRHDGTFVDEALACGVALNGLGRAGASMGTAWGDIDADGLADLFVTKLDVETHTLWRQDPAGLFKDGTIDAGLARARRSTGFGTALGDFDLDGDLDLAYVNGRVFAPGAPGPANNRLPAFWRPYAEPHALLENDGQGRFRSIAADNPDFCGTAEVGRSLCVGDIDNDGDLDMLVTTTAGPARLFRNVAARKGHWLLVRAMDPALQRDAYGAVVSVKAGERGWQRLVNPGTSYQCSHDARVHFGLGDVERIDEIRVRWPDGSSELFTGGDADRLVTLRKGEGAAP